MHLFKYYLLVAPCIFAVLQSEVVPQALLRQFAVLVATVLFGWWISVYLKNLHSARHKVSPQGRAVLVAGSDSEHGFLIACQLSHCGYHVFSGSADVGGEMAQRLSDPKYRADVVELQPTSEASVNDAFQDVSERLLQEGEILHAVVCNVGCGELGELEWISDKLLMRALDQTVVSTARLINRFLPLIREHRARIVICAGPSGRVAIPGAGVHSVVNAALISFADCLRREMFKFKVQVVLVEPVWLSYRTPLSALHSAGTSVKEVLRCTSREVFDDYSLRYTNSFRNLWNQRSSRWYAGPNDVIAACTCRAVNDRLPRPSYVCSHAAERFVNALLQYLPVHFVDIVQCFVYQPFAKLRVWSEQHNAGGYVPTERRISSPGFLQSLLSSSLSPKPVPCPESKISTPARELNEVKAEYQPSISGTADVTPPPRTPPAVVRLRGECFKPHRVAEEPGPCKHSGGYEIAVPPRAPNAGATRAAASSRKNEDAADSTLSADSTLVLSVMSDTQCQILASMFASAKRSAMERMGTPSPGIRVAGNLIGAADSPPSDNSPVPRKMSLLTAISPRTPNTGIRALPANVMSIISPGTSTPSTTTMEDPSESRVDSGDSSREAASRADVTANQDATSTYADEPNKFSKEGAGPDVDAGDEAVSRNSPKGPDKNPDNNPHKDSN